VCYLCVSVLRPISRTLNDICYPRTRIYLSHTARQVKQWRDEGYLLLDGVIDADLVAKATADLRALFPGVNVVCVCVCVCLCVNMLDHILVYIHTYICVYEQRQTCACLSQAYACVSVCVCSTIRKLAHALVECYSMRVCMCVCVCVCLINKHVYV
jgi:hypothetical protein